MPFKSKKNRADSAKPKRNEAVESNPAAVRLGKARARADLEKPTAREILEFQRKFLSRSRLLVYTEDPAVISAARSTPPEDGEKFATYMDRAFGSRKVDVSFAQFVKPDGRARMQTIVYENAGRELNELLKLARREEKSAVAEAREEAEQVGKIRLKKERAKAKERLAADREVLAQFPAKWLADRADEMRDLNKSAQGTNVHDERVIERLHKIAKAVETQAATDGAGGAPIEVVVDMLIESYETMARHARIQNTRLKALQAKLDLVSSGA
ncbi:hypothetical protein [Paraburkholderia tropica]|uniref:hypothetical protein n=1 Tax=Paraburkholderia tropica TaxID=92647 RepID=UPI001F1ED5AF|nr:hypothetical protein [Paraburkholderia tropica]